MTAPTTRCPCGSGSPYDACCGPLHRGERRAASAEQLMRARYSAFAVQDEAFLLETWHASTRPAEVSFAGDQVWTRLVIIDVEGGGLLDVQGVVEFEARFEAAGRAATLHERSRFVREDGIWRYVGPLHATVT